MRFLCIIIVIAVCGNHLTNSAPTQDLRSDAKGSLRSFLLKVDKTLFDLLDLKGNEEDEGEEENQEEEDGYKNDAQDLAPEEPAIPTDVHYLTTSSPAPDKPQLHPLCKARLNNPNQIKSISDIQTRRDVIDYLIYRLCLPTFTTEDIAAIGTIIDQLSLPVGDVRPKPIIAPEAYTLIINTESSQGDDKAVLDQELSTEPLGDQDKLVTQAVSPETDNDASGPISNDNDKVNEAKLTEDTTSFSSCLAQFKVDILKSFKQIRNKQQKRPTEQSASGTPTSSTSVESVDDVVEEAATTAQQSENDSDKLDMAIRVLFDLLMD